MSDIDDQWYWDRRNQKAYYPVDREDGTVTFATVWHASEVDTATDAGALVPVEDISLDCTDTAFDFLDSFRLPDPADLPGDR